jgi:hypothetical protein
MSVPQISCFDNEGGDGGDGGGANAGGDANAGGGDANAGGGDANAGGGDANAKTFDQTAVNKIVEERLARDRKGRETEFKAKYEKLEESHNTLLESKSLSDDERSKLEVSLGDVQNQLRTKEERAKHEKQKIESDYEDKLKTEREAREVWENRFHDSSIQRALQDAAVSNDAYNPDQVVRLLRPLTKLVPVVDDAGNETDQFKPVVDFPDHDEKGVEVTFSGTPSEIVKRMRDLGTSANLFRSNVVAGLGAGNATGGVTPGANGRFDSSKLTPAQYRKIRKENPELLGL